MIEEHPSASVQLSKLGYLVDVWHPRTVCSPVTHDLVYRFIGGAVGVVCIDLPFSRTSLPPDKWQPIVRELPYWYQHAHGVGAQVVLAGWRGESWQHLDLQQLLTDKMSTERRFAACRLPGRAEPETIHVWTRDVGDNLRCRCESSSQQDERLRSKARQRQRSLLSAVAYVFAHRSGCHQWTMVGDGASEAVRL